jgi:hypothetical protein
MNPDLIGIVVNKEILILVFVITSSTGYFGWFRARVRN